MYRLRKVAVIASLSLLLAMTSACTNRASGGVTPGVALGNQQTYFVVKLEKDERGINTLIARALAQRGLRAGTGEKGAAPEGTSAVVTYADRWMWDMTMYMLELSITITDPATGFTLASGNSYHTSLTRKSPEEMVDEVLTNIFEGKAP